MLSVPQLEHICEKVSMCEWDFRKFRTIFGRLQTNETRQAAAQIILRPAALFGNIQ